MLTEIFSYDFMQRAIMAVVAISIFAPILGIFLILRHQSLMSDTLSHFTWKINNLVNGHCGDDCSCCFRIFADGL